MTRHFHYWQLRSCFCGAPSLMRGRVCLLYMLLVLASAVFLGFESLGTRDHILLSQIWDFPFRRLLRLAGSRWRYSTQPHSSSCPDYNILARIAQKHRSSVAVSNFWRSRYLATAVAHQRFYMPQYFVRISRYSEANCWRHNLLIILFFPMSMTGKLRLRFK
jgi:hypothetical protein